MTDVLEVSGSVVETAPELCRLSARTLAEKIRSRQVSSREVASAFLDHIDAVNPRWNAIVSLRPREDILAEADAADRAVAQGERVGPLHGLPQAVKELTVTKGLRTTFGSPIFADNIPTVDAISVERLRAAGAIIIGKTNVPEFGFGSQSYNPIFGVTRNAYAPDRTSGGSSGGAAVALALRMQAVADGSDMGGSLRNPATWNNVFGFRPSQGRVPGWPSVDSFYNQLSTDGPMGRNIPDLATLLSVQSGYDKRAPLSLADPGFRFEDRLDRDVKGLRVGWLGDLDGYLPFEPGVLEVCEQGLGLFRDLGCEIEPVVPKFDFERLWEAFVAIRKYGIGGRYRKYFEDPEKRRLIKPEAQWEIEGSLDLSALDLHAAAETRTAWYGEMLRLFERYDFLALPGAQVFPFDVEQHWPKTVGGREMDSYHRWMEVMIGITLSGCPAISLPSGFGCGPSGERLPMGIQLAGRPRDDLSVLQAAHAYEKIAPWVDVLP